MPSTKNPSTVVNPGSGKIPAATVTVSAFRFTPAGGGGGGGDLAGHILDPIDAHMASAIGIPQVDPLSGLPLSSELPGGDLDGESVLDAIRGLKGLIPISPNKLGFGVNTIPNSGAPNWGNIDLVANGGQAVSGGWTSSGAFFPSNAIVPNAITTTTVTGVLYPADRGVLALYHCTDGAFGGGQTTLIADLALTPGAGGGFHVATFLESLRPVGQADYVSAGSGTDLINLTFRLPYSAAYAGGVPYVPYATDFPQYQLATFTVSGLAVASGNAGSYLLVHWRDSFAVNLAAISTWNTAHLIAANAYSAVPDPLATPPTGETAFDLGDMQNVTKRNIFRDSNVSAPAGTIVTSSDGGSTTHLSGVAFFASNLTLTIQVDTTSLFNTGYLTGTITSSPDVRQDFLSQRNPVEVDFTDFGISQPIGVPYTGLKDGGGTLFNSSSNVPLTADTGRYLATTVAMPTTPSASAGLAEAKANLTRGGLTHAIADSATQYLYNGYTQSGGGSVSTGTLEKFVDEQYRLALTHQPLVGDAFPPTTFKHNSSTALAIYDGSSALGKISSQVIGGGCIYPQTDYTAASPVGPDYHAVFLGDPLDSLRGYIRAFDTGIARTTGRIRIKGIAPNDFKAEGGLGGPTFTDHPGKCVILLQVPGPSNPGVTGFLDLGRAKGDPGVDPTVDFNGCQMGWVSAGSDGYIYSYDMQLPTHNNGSGKFLLYFTITYVKDTAVSTPPGGGIVEALRIQEVEWLPPA